MCEKVLPTSAKKQRMEGIWRLGKRGKFMHNYQKVWKERKGKERKGDERKGKERKRKG